MNLTLRAVYFCATNAGRWGKGLTIKDAKKAAGIIGVIPKKSKLNFYVQAAMFNNPNDKELKNLHDCITADGISGSPLYYQDGRTEEDTKMIDKFHIGWITIEKNY